MLKYTLISVVEIKGKGCFEKVIYLDNFFKNCIPRGGGGERWTGSSEAISS